MAKVQPATITVKVEADPKNQAGRRLNGVAPRWRQSGKKDGQILSLPAEFKVGTRRYKGTLCIRADGSRWFYVASPLHGSSGKETTESVCDKAKFEVGEFLRLKLSIEVSRD
jgi:hypothetical protein